MSLLYDKKEPEVEEKIPKEAVAAKPSAIKNAQERWNNEVKEIKKSLSLEELVFEGVVSHTCSMYSGKISVVFDSLTFDAVDSILNEVYKDSSGELTLSLEAKHSLLLTAASVYSVNGEIWPADRKQKLEKLTVMNHNVAMHMVDKYNQFDAAVKMLAQDGPEEDLSTKLKK